MQPRRQSAFTLIELLVVVAIIALLISILLPSLQKAREQAKAVVSLANLKSQGTAMKQYNDDNRGCFPGDHTLSGRNSIMTWVPRLWKFYLSEKREVFDCPSTEGEARWVKRDGTNLPATLMDIAKSVGYEHFDRPLLGDRIGGITEFFSYGYNGYGGKPQTTGSDLEVGLGGHIRSERSTAGEETQWEPPEKEVKRPDDMIMITDNMADGTWDATVCPEDQASLPSVRHNGGSNVLFVDSHAVTIKFERLTKDDDVERRRWNRDWEPHREWWHPDIPRP